MKKKLLSLLASFTLCASLFAITNMCIKLNDGTVLKYNIDDVEEVYYEGEETQEIMACVKQKDGSVVKYSIANTEQVYYEDEEETPETIPNAGDFCFTFNVTSDSTVEVKDGTKCQDSAIVIPPKVILDGKVYVVTAIGDRAFWGYELVKSVTLPNTIKEIGSYAFCCESLEHINIPESVTSIGEHAFGAPKGGISNLTDIEIPSSVTYIGLSAFYQCYKLKPELLVYSNGTRCYGLLGDRDANTEIVIPDGVTDIDDYAFNYENKLTKVTVPSSVTNIGREAFYGSLNLDLYIDNYEENVKTDAYSINFCKSVTWMKVNEPVAELEYEYVDLGLPSGLKWATTNYGATKPEEPGASIRAYEISAPFFINKWRTPTMKEIEELIENCTWTWIELNGVVGYKVESKEAGNSNWIFLASHVSGDDDFLTYSYWSSSMTSSASNQCLRIYDVIYSNSISKSSERRESMCKVRFVSE